MKKYWFVITMTAAVMLCATTLAQASHNPLAISPKQTIVLSIPTVVGGTLLPAGEYNVQHEMQGVEHIMIFKGIAGTKAEAKAPCSLVPLDRKASQTETRYAENAQNERVLTEFTFRGDTSKHVLVQ